MKKTGWIGAILLLLIANFSWSQEAYTLKQAIDYGVHNNRSVSIYDNNRQRANYREKEAVAGFLPQVNGTATLDDNIKRQTTIIPGAVFGSPVDRSVQFGTQYSSNAVIQLDQTIFDQSVLLGIKAAKPNQQLAQFSYEQNEQTLIYNIANSYYQVYVFEQHLALLKQNSSKYEQLIKIADLQAEKGFLKKVDRDRIQVSLSNVLSQINLAEQNLELAKMRLKNVMGLPLEQNLILADTLMLKEKIDLTTNVSQFNASSRIEYKIQKTQIELYRLDMKRIRGGALPKLTAYGRYGVMAMGNDFMKSYENLFDYSSVGLKLSVNVFDGFRRNSQYHQASFDWKNSQDQLYLNERLYQLEYKNASILLDKSKIGLSNDTKNLDLAREVFQTTTLQYQQGSATMSDFLNSESSYKEAQINYINSLLNYYLAQLDLEKANGTLNNFASELK